MSPHWSTDGRLKKNRDAKKARLRAEVEAAAAHRTYEVVAAYTARDFSAPVQAPPPRPTPPAAEVRYVDPGYDAPPRPDDDEYCGHGPVTVRGVMVRSRRER
jgi:hypothetical protein